MSLAPAIAAARQRHQSALEDVAGDSVQIGSTSYKAAVSLSPVRDVPSEDGSGWEKLQTLTAVIRKTRLRTAPGKRTAITYEGVEYLITSIGGQSPLDVAWRIQADRRSPAAS